MSPTQYHLAQFNIATKQAPLSDPIMAGFVNQLDAINAIAESSPGFVWRLQDADTGNATDIRPYPDDNILVNLSVWSSPEALSNYVYRSQHGGVMRNRSKWFIKSSQPTLVLWWLPADEFPTVPQAKERLDHLRRHGPTPYAFSFRKQFPAPAAIAASGIA